MNTSIQDKKIKIAFFGDTMMGGEFIPYATQRALNVAYPFMQVEDCFREADICVMNFEGPVPVGDNKRPGVTSILSNQPTFLDYLQGKGTFVMNLANNHIMDYGAEALRATIDTLDKHGFYHVGAGMDAEEAGREVVIHVKGLRIAFLAYTSNDPHIGAIIADAKQAGCASLAELETVKNKIRNIKNEVDIICVSLHWGFEYYFYPSYEQVNIAHSLIDAGATHIIGHHPHVIQGIEEYKGSLIIHSLGNFFFPPTRTISGRPQFQKKVAREFMLVQSEIDEHKKINYNIIGGLVTKDYILKPFDNEKKKYFVDKIKKLSRPLISSNYEKFWAQYKRTREKELINESLIEAFRKLFMMPFRELIKTFSVNDIKRNFARLLKVTSKST
jgi:gamma-polyglutamate biosynthesis protein CapA